jgi:hypothetical protein
VSILPTFYGRLFRTKVLSKAFLYLPFRFELFFGARVLAQMCSEYVGEIDQHFKSSFCAKKVQTKNEAYKIAERKTFVPKTCKEKCW